MVNVNKDFMEYLINIGAVEHAFDDPQNKRHVYKFTENAPELVPEIYSQHMKDFNAMVFNLWNKNAIDVTFSENGDPLISLNENSYNFDIIKKLTAEEAMALHEITNIYEKLEES